MFSNIKNTILHTVLSNAVVKKIRQSLFTSKLKRDVAERRGENGRCIFLLATPCHGNLGDHAIVNAEYELLEDLGFSSQLIEITNNEYKKYKSIIRQQVIDNDVILVDGGGNLGTLWPWEDDKISEIIETYHKNKVIVFPQTCYYSDDEKGKARLENNRKVYASNKKALITLRDKKSYNFFQDQFPEANSVYVPDIVLFSNFCKQTSRNGVMLCFRKDKEKVVSDGVVQAIKELLKENSLSWSETDTVIPKRVVYSNRGRELNKKLAEFSRASLVITDRLHGMIFAAITGTPCIAVDNISKKVSGVHQWINYLDYVKICKDAGEIKESILDMYGKAASYDNEQVKDALRKLKSEFDS